MKHTVQTKLFQLIFTALFFYAAFVSVVHLHAPEHKQHHTENCKICIIVHNFVAPDLSLPQSPEFPVWITEAPKPSFIIFYDTSSQKNFHAQAPPA